MKIKFGFLNESVKKGILGKVELSKKELSPKKNIMYKIHRNMCTKVSKLKKALENEKSQLKILQQLYDEGRFEIMHNELNDVTKNFINSQLRNVNKTNGKRWTTEDKAFALSLYKPSPRLYRYLENQFELPSIRTLKTVLSKIPFASGLNPAILNYLKTQGTTNQAALSALCNETNKNDGGYDFIINNQIVFVIYDVPHLFKNTRNCLIKCKIEFGLNKFAKLGHIQNAYELDQKVRTYKQLRKLKQHYFNFADSYIKMKIKIAAQELSESVAAAIETFTAVGLMPTEALHTAEFVHQIDKIFDSLNGFTIFIDAIDPVQNQGCEVIDSMPYDMPQFSADDLIENQASAYVAGYILKALSLPNCVACQNQFLSKDVSRNHIFVNFEEFYDDNRLLYANDNIIELVKRIHICGYEFLDKHGQESDLENKIKHLYQNHFKIDNCCSEHNFNEIIVDKCVRLIIYKYVREKNEDKKNKPSKGHTIKIKRFQNAHLFFSLLLFCNHTRFKVLKSLDV
ncbi:hypothetical protein ILUMI_02867 [Ignelater luminosus]|uniref:Uncharacterized protein n=1 Tax=Ignelater luminosus TaxID=2038154 RepID=A0A8K0DHK6_IGNLU|nr:hypothetical protein ILUMI_02867 [Ignelater luminosus]